MKFTPDYCVSYHGKFYNAGCAFEIDSEDAEEMSRHGTVADDGENAAVNKPGRPKKAAGQ